jgi:pimeloyl-ACP methyl ester carboxylesterase
MAEPQLNHVQCLGTHGLHRMAYWEWGARSNPRVLVCVHGLSRQGRDFDTLAQRLAGRYRVICPDVAGRGESDRLPHPQGYQVPAYVADMVTLLARLDVEQVDWVGTSMGGLIGLGLAAMPQSPIRRLVLNDVGPAIRYEALERIGTYLGLSQHFENLEQGAAYLWSISQSFGPHTPEQWLDLSRPMFKPEGPGLKLHYDPQIALPFRALTPELAAQGEALLWHAYDSLRQPTLLLRGAESDLLARETALQMTQRGPKARLHEFIGVGHAPTLVNDEQLSVVQEFLNED